MYTESVAYQQALEHRRTARERADEVLIDAGEEERRAEFMRDIENDALKAEIHLAKTFMFARHGIVW